MKNTKKKNKSYKTVKQYNKPMMSVLFIIVVLYLISTLFGRVGYQSSLSIPMLLTILVLLALGELYFYTGDYKRRIFSQKGECFLGYIESAVVAYSGRGEHKYSLKISFFDKEKKYIFTEYYVGNPNKKLKTRKCDIYRYNGKYIEGKMEIRNKNEGINELGIPILQKK